MANSGKCFPFVLRTIRRSSRLCNCNNVLYFNGKISNSIMPPLNNNLTSNSSIWEVVVA